MIAEMVREMVGRGVDLDVICLAVETAERALLSANSTGIPVDRVAEKRRAYDRERKRNSTGIPPESTGIPNSHLSKNIDKKEREKRGTRIPPEFPSAEDRDFAKTLGWSEAQIDSQVADFRDYWTACPGAKGVKLDWVATWRRWCRNSRVKPVASLTTTIATTSTNWRPILESYQRFKHWPKGHGNEPGSPSCRAPPELLREFGFLKETG